MITYVSIELGWLFENLYEGRDSLKILSETENIQDQNGYNRKSKLILKKLLCEVCWFSLHKRLMVQELVHWLASKSDKSFRYGRFKT